MSYSLQRVYEPSVVGRGRPLKLETQDGEDADATGGDRIIFLINYTKQMI